MKDENAQQLLTSVMGWDNPEDVKKYVQKLQLLADYKYDHYQRFGPGKRFIESLALWLNQLKSTDRSIALDFVADHLIFISESEFSHLVQTAYPDWIVQERIRLVSEEKRIPLYRVQQITTDRRFQELGIKSLYLGLSDGARTNDLRRASNGEINNEQIWQAYELSKDKAADMSKELKKALESAGYQTKEPRFNMIWLLDDFSGSGNTYIRFDKEKKEFKGKIKKIYESLHSGDLIDPAHYEVFLLLYVATRQAVDHIEYWAEQFTSERGYKPLQLRTLFLIEPKYALNKIDNPELSAIIETDEYYDDKATDTHILVGGTEDARWGFAGCALPVVLAHNTPNNSIYILWGPETFDFCGLFPRMSRHREL